MKKNKKQVRAYSLGGLLFIVLLAVIIALLVGGIITIPKLQDGIFKAYRAAGAVHTSNVLSDLCKDAAFDPADYPENAEDYTLSVIQIAESKDSELVVYAYQPSGKGKGSSINISRFKSDAETQDFKNYELERLDSDGVFFKYRVVGFELSADIVRFYNVSSILREYIDGIDKLPQGDNTVSEVPFPVGWCYSAATFNGELYYGKEKADTIEVVAKIVGYVRYKDGGLFPIAIENDTDLFFVAFKTDRKIDELKSVKIGWNYVGYKSVYYSGGYVDGVYSPPSTTVTEQSRGSEEQTIAAKDEMFNYADGLFGRRFSWDAIQTTTDYIAKQNNDYYLLDDDADLTATDWVVSFAKYKYTVVGASSEHCTTYYTQVSDVILLQLNFIRNGRAYNLGAVDNKQAGGDDPINTPKEVPWYVKLWDAVCWVFAKIWSIISAPLTLLWNRYKPWIITALCVICGISLLSFIVGLFKK